MENSHYNKYSYCVIFLHFGPVVMHLLPLTFVGSDDDNRQYASNTNSQTLIIMVRCWYEVEMSYGA